MIDIERAKQAPAVYFDRPGDVVTAEELDTEQRIEILRQWEYDVRLLQVATEENMDASGSESGNAGISLQEIHEALNHLGGSCEPTSGGTKLG